MNCNVDTYVDTYRGRVHSRASMCFDCDDKIVDDSNQIVLEQLLKGVRFRGFDKSVPSLCKVSS